MDSSAHGISQTRILEWVAISFSRGSSQGLNLHLLHWQADSLLLSHQGNPYVNVYIMPYAIRASLIAQLVKNPLAMQETLVRLLGWEDPLEKG